MSGVNLDALSDEQVDAMIAGCRALRALRAPYVNADAMKTSPADPSLSENTTSAGEPSLPPAPADAK